MKRTFVILVATMVSGFLLTQCQKGDLDGIYHAGNPTSESTDHEVNKEALPGFASAPGHGQSLNRMTTVRSIQSKWGKYPWPVMAAPADGRLKMMATSF